MLRFSKNYFFKFTCKELFAFAINEMRYGLYYITRTGFFYYPSYCHSTVKK